MKHTRYHIQAMDCSAEQQMVRMCLEDLEGVSELRFDMATRHVDVYHDGSRGPINAALERLGLGVKETAHTVSAELPESPSDPTEQRALLYKALGINMSLFVLELVAGLLIAGSMGLVADGLDMLADSLVYGLSLAAVGGTMARKKRLARYSGSLQLVLACFGLIEVTRRFWGDGEAPGFLTMIIISCVALVGNAATLVLLRRTRTAEVHLQASWIFTSNDILVNLLVIVAALLVWWTGSLIPDLIVGGLIFLVVAQGARRIFKMAR